MNLKNKPYSFIQGYQNTGPDKVIRRKLDRSEIKNCLERFFNGDLQYLDDNAFYEGMLDAIRQDSTRYRKASEMLNNKKGHLWRLI